MVMESVRVDWPIIYLLCNVLTGTARKLFWCLWANYRPMTYDELMDLMGIERQTLFRAYNELAMYNLALRHKKKQTIFLTTREYHHLKEQKDVKLGISPAIPLERGFNEKKYVTL